MTTTLQQQLDQLVEAAFNELALTVQGKAWSDALSAQLEWLFWRTMSLALRAGMLPDAGMPGGSVLAKINSLFIAVGTPAPNGSASGDPQSKRRDAVMGVLEGLRTVLITLQQCAEGEEEASSMLVLAGGELGRADIMLALAEANHWQHIIDLEEAAKKKPKGRPGDYRPLWEREFEKAAVVYAGGKPVGRSELIHEAKQWHNNYISAHQKGLGLPGTDAGIGKGVDRLAALGKIQLKHLSQTLS